MTRRFPVKTIGRLSLYRRLLNRLEREGRQTIYSHELANLACGTAAQVRRDLMAVGYSGRPAHGYEISKLVRSIGDFLDAPSRQNAALVGVGNLGRAILAFFAGRRPRLSIVAAFDIDPQKTDRTVQGCRCYPMEALEDVVRREDVDVAVIAVPASEAQRVADQLCAVGVRGLLNFAPTQLTIPDCVFVEHVDITTALEKVAFFARQYAQEDPDRTAIK